jgi:hypothetical protein
MSHRKISAALSSRLNTLTDAPPIAFENVPFTPVEGTTWLRESYLPATSSTVGMEPGGSTDFIGVYQVSIYAPLDDYKFESHQLIDSITAHFARGTMLVFEGQSVVVEQVNVAQGLASGGWWLMPVSVNWRAFG